MQPELSHKEAFKEAARNWGVSDANPQKRVSLVRNRRCIKRNRTPVWPACALEASGTCTQRLSVVQDGGTGDEGAPSAQAFAGSGEDGDNEGEGEDGDGGEDDGAVDGLIEVGGDEVDDDGEEEGDFTAGQIPMGQITARVLQVN